MKESLILKEQFPVAPNIIYAAWLDSNLHTKMTGGKANCSANVGDTFSAWDGYVEGKNLELKPNKKIVQSWRTTEFFKDDEDSLLTLEFKERNTGAELVLIHTNIPEGQTQYKQGWIDHYFTPMKAYFSAE